VISKSESTSSAGCASGEAGRDCWNVNRGAAAGSAWSVPGERDRAAGTRRGKARETAPNRGRFVFCGVLPGVLARTELRGEEATRRG
jgi:hypothetical protein